LPRNVQLRPHRLGATWMPLHNMATPRPGAPALSASTNFTDGVCIFCDSLLRVHSIELHAEVRVVRVLECAYVHRAGFNAFVVVVYRSCSPVPSTKCLTDMTDLLECVVMSAYSVFAMGDFDVLTRRRQRRQRLYRRLRTVCNCLHDPCMDSFCPPTLSDHSFI
jgi:hypothetical protein